MASESRCCCYVFCCPNCAAGDVAALSGGSYLCDCCCCATPCQWTYTRARVRSKVGIEEGSCLVDYCTIQCCPQCSLIQELNELERASSYSAMPEILVAPVQQQQPVVVMQQAPPGYPPQPYGAPCPNTAPRSTPSTRPSSSSTRSTRRSRSTHSTPARHRQGINQR